MVYQLNIQTIPLTRRSHLIVRFPVAGAAAWVWSITAAVRRPRIRTACLAGSITSSLTLTTCPGWPGSGRRHPAGRSLCARAGEIVAGTIRTRPPACALCRSRIRRRSRTACTSTWPAARRVLGRPGQPRGSQFCAIRPKETLSLV